MVHRGTQSRAEQDRRAERGSLHCMEEPNQVSSVKLLKRSEMNALSHGYSGADCRGNGGNAETDCEAGKLSWRRNCHRGADLRQSGTGQLDRWPCFNKHR